MGDESNDKQGDSEWLPPDSANQPAGSTPPPGAAGPGEAKWGAPAPPPAPTPAGGSPAFYPAPSGATESLGKATTSLVLGILGLLCCPLILSVIALIYGYDARKRIDNSGGRYNNRGSATAGIVLGWVGIVWGILSLIYVITQLDSPDNNDDGIPDGLQVIAPVLIGCVRIAGSVGVAW